MKRPVSLSLAAVLALCAAPVSADEAGRVGGGAKDGMLQRALGDELERSMGRLALPGMPRPYYLAYEVTDYDQLTFGAQMGALVTHDRERARFLRVVVRVGSPELDNTNAFGEFRGFDHPAQLPLEEDYGAIRRRVWLATDDAYKDAVEALEKKRAALSTQSASTDDAGDFSPAAVTRVVTPASPQTAEESSLASLVKDASAVYRDIPEVQSGRAAVVVTRTRRLLLSSDGALVDEPRTVVRFDAAGHAQAADGMDLERYVTYTVGSPDKLPKTGDIVQAVRDSAIELARAGKAPAVAEYAGPVLFEPRAAAQLLRTLMSEQLSGAPAPRGGDARMMQAMDGLESDLVSRIGQRVLPVGFSVVDDPTKAELGGKLLLGAYRADDEGVRAEPVRLVEDGMLRTLLMSRAPRKELAQSNGHGRAGLAGNARARPANLVFSTSRGLTSTALKQRLLAEVKAAGLPYGIIVRALEEPGLVGEGTPAWLRDDNALPDPVELVKVTLDGKEQPLRGGTLGGIQLRTLKTIIAAGSTPEVLSYFAGVGGGFRSMPLGGARMTLWGLPTSLAAPALLFPDIDVRRNKGPQNRLPFLARPDLDQRK